MQVTSLAAAPDWVVASCVGQLRQLYGSQTAPFLAPFADYAAGLQRARELEVRLLQLDKEGAELRDENASLHRRLSAADEAAAANTAAQLEDARAALGRSERELVSLYRDKASLLEEVVGSNTALTTARSALESTTTQLAQSRAEVSALREQLCSMAANLEAERAARLAASAELAAALTTRDSALTQAERHRQENAVLVRRLVELKEGEAGRMNDLNRMHEELLEQTARMKQEAELDRQATDLIRQKAVATALAGAAAASAMAGGGGGGGMVGAPSAAAASVMIAAPPSHPSAAATAAAAPAGPGQAPPLATSPPTAAGPATFSDPLTAGGSDAASAEWVSTPPMPIPASPTTSTSTFSTFASPGPSAAAAGPSSASPGAVSIPTSLRDAMGLGRHGHHGSGHGYSHHPDLRDAELREPGRLPVRVVPSAHRGGCCSLAAQAPGHFVASCGADRAVALWDVSLLVGPGSIHGGGSGAATSPAVLLHGMTAGVNDCGFTCDAAQVVAAGADKSLHVWDATSGRHAHTLTGHSGAVTAVALSPMDARLAVSVSEDRSFKLWDLGRGYSVRSVPCAKMPLSLAMSRDGNTVVTGHLDGSVLLWDVRQCRAGAAAPLMEARDQSQPVVALTPAAADDSTLVVAARDGSMRLWDFRGGALLRLMRHPAFSLGTTGGTGRPRCHLGVSPDGRLLAAGAADGSVWVWELRGGGEPKQLRGGPGGTAAHREAVVATAFSSDLTALLSADKAGGLAFWAME